MRLLIPGGQVTCPRVWGQDRPRTPQDSSSQPPDHPLHLPSNLPPEVVWPPTPQPPLAPLSLAFQLFGGLPPPGSPP